MKLLPVPAKNAVYLLLAPLFLLILSLFVRPVADLLIYADILIFLIAAADLLRAYGNRDFSLSVAGDGAFYMNRPGKLAIAVEAGSISGFDGEFRFDLPRFWTPEGAPETWRIEGGKKTVIEYPLKALRRGHYRIEKLHIRFTSPLGIFRLYGKKDLDLQLPVHPDYRELKEYFQLVRNNRLFEMGIHRNRYRGQGTELESLREYTKDDDARHIDWKASSRLNRPVTKVFQMESVNDVVFALDCGRLMTSEEKGKSSIDLAVEALLLLSHVASSMGDRIRIITFSDRITGDFSPPRHGNVMKRIISFITPVQPEFVESNYGLVFSHLRHSLAKRSLVIFVTDLIDDINYDMFRKNLMQLGRRNAILFLLLRDRLLQEESEREGETTGEVYAIAAARAMMTHRSRAVEKLRQSGINVLDVLPREVSARLVDKYLEMKAGNRI